MLLDPEQSWPPEEPDRDHKFDLPNSPWTYDNGSVNPNLQPSNAQLRQSAVRQRRRKELGASTVPPYHPDYQPGDVASMEGYDSSSSSSSVDRHPRVRSGSEGYEVRTIDREEMLQQYLKDLEEEPDKYVRYIPEPDSDSGSDDEMSIPDYSNAMPDAVDI